MGSCPQGATAANDTHPGKIRITEAKHIRSRRKARGAVTELREQVPRLTRLLALALKFEEMIRSGVVDNYAVLAQLGEVSRSRITQTNLLNLAPDIQEEILFLRPAEAERLRMSELSVRKLSAITRWKFRETVEWYKIRARLEREQNTA